MKQRICGMLLVGCTFFAGSASAVDTLTVQELKDLCLDADPQSSRVCTFYLRGFLDGALTTDPLVVENVARELEDESFSERAFRTRLGPRLEHYGAAYFADLCVTESVSVDDLYDVVSKALETLASRNAGSDSAREFVYQVLRENYPC